MPIMHTKIDHFVIYGQDYVVTELFMITSFFHPVFLRLSSYSNANYAYKNRSFYKIWEYVVTELFMIASFLYPVFPFLSLGSHLNVNYAYKSGSFYHVWEYVVTK